MERLQIAKCCEPQMYKTPNNNTAIGQAVKTCVLNNSGNKALQALSLYQNGEFWLFSILYDNKLFSEQLPEPRVIGQRLY